MRGSGNALMFGLGGLALGTMFTESKAKALTQQLHATQQALQSARSEVSREREMRIGAERSRDDQRRIANENASVVAARDVEIQKLKVELAKLRAEAKEPKKEDKKT